MQTEGIHQLDPSFLFFELPLYQEIKVTYNDLITAVSYLNFSNDKRRNKATYRESIRLKGINPYTQEQTTFKIAGSDLNYDKLVYSGGHFEIVLQCLQTDYTIRYYFLSSSKDNQFFNVHDSVGDDHDPDEEKIEVGIQKIGQYPSLADFHASDYRKFKTILSDERMRELKRAVGLAAHGVGIGSFVYLRRIFEDLIWVSFGEGEILQSWDKSRFQGLRMDEKIKFLANYLPPIMVTNSHLYSIVSKGIHSLSEKECLQYFPVLKIGIELILEQKVDQLTQRKKEKDFTDTLKKINQQLGKS